MNNPEAPQLAAGCFTYLEVDGETVYQPADVKAVSEAYHHRVSILTFPGVDADGNHILDGANRTLALVTDAGQPLSDPAPSWVLPLESAAELSQGTP